MPSTTTPVQSPKIKLIAGQASTFAALLSVLHLLPPAEQPDTLTMLADFADELASDLAALVRGAA